MRSLLAVALVTSLAGCAVSSAALVTVSKKLATDCEKHCAVLDMRLAAVVVVANHGGCVCEPTSASASETLPAGGAAASGSGAVAAVEQMQREQRNRDPSRPSDTNR